MTTNVRAVLGPEFPTIVTLCGSTRFGEAFRAAQLRETLAGKIVLTIGCDTHSDKQLGLGYVDKRALDELHLRKIDISDEVLVLNVGGYIGHSTGNELAYAAALGKRVRTLEPMDVAAWLEARVATRVETTDV